MSDEERNSVPPSEPTSPDGPWLPDYDERGYVPPPPPPQPKPEILTPSPSQAPPPPKEPTRRETKQRS
jgi:hypothetical protein